MSRDTIETSIGAKKLIDGRPDISIRSLPDSVGEGEEKTGVAHAISDCTQEVVKG
jgi:hypothetical protein